MKRLLRPFARIVTTPALALSLLGAVTVSVAPMALTACKNGPTIPGTEIPDTEDNREILQTLERFRTAFVRQDAATILSTAHESYYDEGGTDDPYDDIVYEELGRTLKKRMNQIESVRFTMEYLQIFVNRDRATVDVWMDASFRMKPILDEEGNERIQARFARQQDYARFELIRDGEGWLITKGI
ncbi:MAG: hypothetical protein H6713_36140 [Myxococcales bacterium]|nr:hypothetical protein [Myxococcales bacterium]MCB9755402.1 hypothetical protein [Myxococcales bacterium]